MGTPTSLDSAPALPPKSLRLFSKGMRRWKSNAVLASVALPRAGRATLCCAGRATLCYAVLLLCSVLAGSDARFQPRWDSSPDRSPDAEKTADVLQTNHSSRQALLLVVGHSARLPADASVFFGARILEHEGIHEGKYDVQRLPLQDEHGGGVTQVLRKLATFAEASADAVFLPYTVVLAERAQGQTLLREACRVLKEHGLMLALAPDLAAIARVVDNGMGEGLAAAVSTGALSGGRASGAASQGVDVVASPGSVRVHTLLYGQEGLAHRFGFTSSTLEAAVVAAGFGGGRVDHVGVMAVDFELWAAARKPRGSACGGVGDRREL